MDFVSRLRQLTGLIPWLLLSFSAAAVGAVASVSAGAFYQALARPEWAPPAWLFGPVWTILYLLMAIAAWLVWRTVGLRTAAVALSLFVIQLVANALWTWLYFRFHLGAIAFAEILVLWLLILSTILAFWRIRRTAAVLLLPYFAWVSFAIALSYSTWQLNPGTLG